MSSKEECRYSADAFVIAGFVFMWLVGFYPLLASVIAMYSDTGAVILLASLPVVMAVVLIPLWRRQERRTPPSPGAA